MTRLCCRHPIAVTLLLLGMLPLCALAVPAQADEQLSAGWRCHVIDDSSRGADGVRLADLNGDGRLDIATGWEEGGRVRVCLQPESAHVRERWPAVTVGQVKSPEDAFFYDFDGDGQLDVISCCEGKTRTVFAHLAPRDPDRLLDQSAWRTVPLAVSTGQTNWMFGLPGPAADQMVCGSKNPDGRLGYFELTADRDPAAARWQTVQPAGWIMSLIWSDLDGDGHPDLVYSDRKGAHRGCWMLRNPGTRAPLETWERILLGGSDAEVMFLSVQDLDADRRPDLLVAVKGGPIRILRNRTESDRVRFEEVQLPELPGTGSGKAVVAGDLTGDGQLELVVSCEHAEEKHGLYAISVDSWLAPTNVTLRPISGTARGIKFDLIELLDLDGDGDLDILTCEERDNLGVIWYENPTR